MWSSDDRQWAKLLEPVCSETRSNGISCLMRFFQFSGEVMACGLQAVERAR